jgi:hypothetical protein
MATREQLIVETWDRIGKEVVGAADLNLIQAALAERFGAESSPALIARVLADHGARLAHPEILQTDVRWREGRRLFTPDDLSFDSITSAFAFIEKLQQANDQPALRQSVQQIKLELEYLATSSKAPASRRVVAREVAQWLTVWLQNPQIFSEWLELRRSTNEFRGLFGTFPSPQANTNDQSAQTGKNEPEKRPQR